MPARRARCRGTRPEVRGAPPGTMSGGCRALGPEDPDRVNRMALRILLPGPRAAGSQATMPVWWAPDGPTFVGLAIGPQRVRRAPRSPASQTDAHGSVSGPRPPAAGSPHSGVRCRSSREPAGRSRAGPRRWSRRTGPGAVPKVRARWAREAGRCCCFRSSRPGDRGRRRASGAARNQARAACAPRFGAAAVTRAFAGRFPVHLPRALRRPTASRAAMPPRRQDGRASGRPGHGSGSVERDPEERTGPGEGPGRSSAPAGHPGVSRDRRSHHSLRL